MIYKTNLFKQVRIIQQFLNRFDLELIFLIASLVALAISDPEKEHFDLCIFHWLGFNYCPGCGLGHSISWFFRGEFLNAFESHFFGIPAVFIILHRIIQLILVNLKKHKLMNLIQ